MMAESLVIGVRSALSLPMIFTKLNDAVNDPCSSSRDISNIISEDAGLSAHLLRIANSAFFGFPKKIDTITRAVTVIGTKQLRDLALATSVVHMFKGIPNEFVNMESFWRHSIACGLTARILANFRRESNVEKYFVAGLLHDVGRLIIYMNAADLARMAIKRAHEENALLYEMENEVMGFDHAEVGSLLLRQWQLPEHTMNAVACHHKPSKANGYAHDASIIHVADIIANSMQLGSSGERFVPPLDEDAWECLSLSESIIPPALQLLGHQYSDIVRIILHGD